MTAINQVGNALTGASGTGSFAGTDSPIFVTPVLGTPTSGVLTNCTGSPTFSQVSFSSTSGIIGTTTNDNAAAGSVGEFISSNQTGGIVLTSTIAITITSISLTAGDWDVWGQVIFSPAVAAAVNYISGSISLTNNTVDGTHGSINIQSYGGQVIATYISNVSSLCNVVRLSLASTTTVYLIAASGFTSSMSAEGIINARRVR